LSFRSSQDTTPSSDRSTFVSVFGDLNTVKSVARTIVGWVVTPVGRLSRRSLLRATRVNVAMAPSRNGRPSHLCVLIVAFLGLLVCPATSSRLGAARQVQQAQAPAPSGVLTNGEVLNDQCVADSNPSNVNWIGQVAAIEQVGVFVEHRHSQRCMHPYVGSFPNCSNI
jgi:hypothetical protein